VDKTITVRLDPETGRILRTLARPEKCAKAKIIKEALRNIWEREVREPKELRPTSWEVYSQLLPEIDAQPTDPKRDRARHAKKLIRGIPLAKRRAGTL
jgi:hypothetical protein